MLVVRKETWEISDHNHYYRVGLCPKRNQINHSDVKFKNGFIFASVMCWNLMTDDIVLLIGVSNQKIQARVTLDRNSVQYVEEGKVFVAIMLNV